MQNDHLKPESKKDFQSKLHTLVAKRLVTVSHSWKKKDSWKRITETMLWSPCDNLYVIKHVLPEKHRKCLLKHSQNTTSTAFSFTISTLLYTQERTSLPYRLILWQNSRNKYFNAYIFERPCYSFYGSHVTFQKFEFQNRDRTKQA